MNNVTIEKLVAIMLFVSFATFNMSANSSALAVGPIPAISNISPGLKKAIDALKARVKSDAKGCAETAKGMRSTAQYSSFIRKVLDTDRVVALHVSGDMICDGVHPSSFQYGVAFEKASGKRLDLNRVYNIAIRQDGRLFVRPDLIDSVKTSYMSANKNNPFCLSATELEDELANFPITFSPLPDGSIALYYAAPDVSAVCFPALRLEPNEFSKFRDVKQAPEIRIAVGN
ncbi:hypothetical protein [Caballeronia sp. LZ001]|uniref:hypothetical protein n=1 Tax=Caballeronia sp. LZ001 TaxID=3038553 RepID=UPI00285B3454|nr:hypothetical protein [Caballeronia sp. LZ001]MDR5800879.1 hypothetical protein [Caballeronia sp. LZ001]